MIKATSAQKRNPDDLAEALSPTVAMKTEAPSGLDVRGLQKRLEEHVAPGASPSGTPPREKAAARATTRRVFKILLGASALAVFGLLPLRTLTQTSSVEALVNARVIALRAPIAGEVLASPADLAKTDVLPMDTPLLRIVNPRADRTRLDDIRRQREQLANQRKAVSAKLETTRLSEAELSRVAEQFRLSRIEQLEARVAEQDSLIAAAVARKEEADAAKERATALARTGNVSAAEIARVTRDAIVATETEVSTRHHLTAMSIELKAARAGLFLGDSYNDRPSSVQRADELRQRIAELGADLTALDAELERLAAEATDEKTRFEAVSNVTMALPTAGRIWETMVSPGEQVRVGQDLVKLIDCATAIITANVTESVYNRLALGSPARFIPADGGKELFGKVVNLTGLAGAPANLAIEPAALSKEPYRVTVSVPGIGSPGACGVGRTGRVVFGEQAGAP